MRTITAFAAISAVALGLGGCVCIPGEQYRQLLRDGRDSRACAASAKQSDPARAAHAEDDLRRQLGSLRDEVGQIQAELRRQPHVFAEDLVGAERPAPPARSSPLPRPSLAVEAAAEAESVARPEQSRHDVSDEALRAALTEINRVSAERAKSRPATKSPCSAGDRGDLSCDNPPVGDLPIVPPDILDGP